MWWETGIRSAPLGPGSRHYDRVKSLLDVLLPAARAVGPHGELRKGIGATVSLRLRYFAMFVGDIDDADTFIFSTSLDMTDSTILDWIEEEGPMILLSKLVACFPRHRWLGGQEVGEALALFASTHGLAESCLPEWLGTSAPKRSSNAAASSRQVVSHCGFGSDSDDAPGEILVPAGDLGSCLDAPMEETAPARPTAEFYQKKKQEAIGLALPGRRADLLIFCICNNHMNKGLRSELYNAGERFDRDNDAGTSRGDPRRYRITTAASNETARRAAAAACKLLTCGDGWLALADADKTVARRALAYCTLTKQQGSLIINTVTKHEMTPHLAFQAALCIDYKKQQQFANMCSCLHCEFAAYWLAAHPGTQFSKPDNLDALAEMAEQIKCASTSSENGHAYWQAVCRVRSLQTNADQLERCSATSLMRQNRRYEHIPAVEPKPARAGRPRRSKIATMKSTSVTKPKRQYNATRRAGVMGPWQLYCQDNSVKSSFGGEQFQDKWIDYGLMKSEPGEFDKLRLRARAVTAQRQAALRDIVGGKEEVLPDVSGTLASSCALVALSAPSSGVIAVADTATTT